VFGCLPSQLLAEDASILQLAAVYGLGNDEEWGE
jgi:hypothetical protein